MVTKRCGNVSVVSANSINRNRSKNDGQGLHNNFQKSNFNAKSAVKILDTE